MPSNPKKYKYVVEVVLTYCDKMKKKDIKKDIENYLNDIPGGMVARVRSVDED